MGAWSPQVNPKQGGNCLMNAYFALLLSVVTLSRWALLMIAFLLMVVSISGTYFSWGKVQAYPGWLYGIHLGTLALGYASVIYCLFVFLKTFKR
jgi:hypothetical protein